ncbi:unknown; predicted coding region [Mycoplasmopsis pulmonis]|uniref:Uncharacterized protein n=1 Tax=Mycoplasmopsis pulmonis (strain UAB CTIP) TaxID=272635 RepID=Q98QJ6_MYCPU|nr:unknown; predicted coding region [Mycoplasmopsis pulmonis]
MFYKKLYENIKKEKIYKSKNSIVLNEFKKIKLENMSFMLVILLTRKEPCF